MGIITTSKFFNAIFTPLLMSQLPKHFTALVWWNTVYNSNKFSLCTICWDHQLSTSLRVAATFPAGYFITIPLLNEYLQKYPPPANSTPLQLSTKEYKSYTTILNYIKASTKTRLEIFLLHTPDVLHPLRPISKG